MTRHATPFGIHSSVRVLHLFHILLLVGMTAITEIRERLEQLVFVIGAVRAVTSGAPDHLNDCMDMLLFELLLHVRMTHETEVLAFLYQLFGIGRFVRVMAAQAFSAGHRHMHKLVLGHGFVMAGEAELADRRSEKELGIRGLVRTMAEGAVPGGHGPVHHGLGILGLMAHVAQNPAGVHDLEGIVLFQLMAGRAFTGGKWEVHRPIHRGRCQILVAVKAGLCISLLQSGMAGRSRQTSGRHEQTEPDEYHHPGNRRRAEKFSMIMLRTEPGKPHV